MSEAKQSDSTAELSKPVQWRMLNRADTIMHGDQGLNDDCETWHEVMPIFCGMLYNPGFFVPIRRRVPNAGGER